MAATTIRTTPRPSCYLCGTPGELLYEGLQDRLYDVPGEWSLRRCPQGECGLVWLDPFPIEDDIPKLYDSYHTHHLRKGLIQRCSWWMCRSLLSATLGYPPTGWASWGVGSLIARVGMLKDAYQANTLWLPTPAGRLLDVGCGSGEFLERMHELGWDVSGVEPDPKAAAIARQRGFPVQVGTIEQTDFGDETFDAITLSHVIEHLPDPIATLSACKKLLKPEGKLVVATPNCASQGASQFSSDWRGWEVPRHLHLFGVNSIRTLALKAGFHSVQVRTSARIAAFIWLVSRRLQTQAKVSGDVNPFRPLQTTLALWYQLRENARIRKHPVGEEVVLVATAPAHPQLLPHPRPSVVSAIGPRERENGTHR